MSRKLDRLSKEDLEQAVKVSDSFRSVLKLLKISKSLIVETRQKIISLGLDHSHFRISGYPARPLSSILVNGPSNNLSTHDLKKRLIKEGVFEHECYKCNLKEWLGIKIPLELEHKNGNNKDFRIENLTLLCPNCHALSPFYRGRNTKKYKEKLSSRSSAEEQQAYTLY